jgi:tRNA G18 (ribose-2'-O)-methylase SpoU
MPLIQLDDLDDSRIAVYRQIKATNTTRDSGLFVLEGERLLDRLIASPQYPLHSALVTDRMAESIAAKLDPAIPVYVISHESIARLVGYNFHLGVLSCGCERDWPEPIELARQALERSSRLTLVACPAVQNPENLGAIVRIADVFGVDVVLAGGDCPDPLARRVLRVSMGTVLRLPVCRVGDLAHCLEQLRDALGVELVATVTDPDAERLNRFHRPERLALLLGNEAHGLTDAWVRLCSRRLTIPMRRGAESLNVAVAAGVVLHALMTGSDY